MREYLDPEAAERIVQFYQERFGLSPKIFVGHGFIQGSRQRIYLVAHDLLKTSVEVVSGINVCRIGAAVKPTTDFLQLHSAHISKNTVELCAGKTKRFIRGEDLELSDEETRVATDGYICLKFKSFALGCAFLRGTSAQNLIAKDRRREIDYL